jgi:hypothetical protein
MFLALPFNHIILRLSMQSVLRTKERGQAAVFPVVKNFRNMSVIAGDTWGMT